jgi:hypothetical protein
MSLFSYWGSKIECVPVPLGPVSATNQSIKSNKYAGEWRVASSHKMRSCISALTEGAGQVMTGMTGELRVAYMKSCRQRLSRRELPFRAVRIADSSPLRRLEGRRVGQGDMGIERRESRQRESGKKEAEVEINEEAEGPDASLCIRQCDGPHEMGSCPVISCKEL